MARRGTQGLALLLATFPLVLSALVALTGFVWGLGLQCDENCTGEDWQHTAGAPQWTGLTMLGFVVFGCGIAMFVFVYRSRPWHALVALALGVVMTLSALAFRGSLSVGHLDRHPMGVAFVAGSLCVGVLASFLCAPAEKPGSDPRGVRPQRFDT